MKRKVMQSASNGAFDTIRGGALWLCLGAIACLTVQFSSALADEGTGEWVRTENAILRLISAWDGVGPDGQALIGVQIRLSPRWKTYWRWPGETGVPTEFDWSGSTNLSRLEVHWPAPKRFSEYEMQTFGYDGEVIFPVSITSEAADQPVELNLRLTYGVCKEVCVPMETKLRMVLPSTSGAGEGTDVSEGPSRTAHARHIERFGKRVPGENGDHGLTIEAAVLRESDDGNELEVRAHSDSPFAWPDLAVTVHPLLRLGVPLVDLSYNRHDVRLRMPLTSRPGASSLVGAALSIVLWDEDGRAVETRATVEAAPAPVSD